MNNRRYLFLGTITVLTVSLLFFGVHIIEVFGTHTEIFQKTKIFTEILVRIMEDYVDEVDTDKLVNKAINSIMEELDPHTNYVPPKDFSQMSDRFLGYQGIGIQFRMMNNKITTMRVLSGGPSERAGLKLGDRIVKIEGKNAIGIRQEEVPLILKGPAGTKVTVTIERAGVDNNFDITITRGQAFVESIKYYYMIDDITAYLEIETFSRTTADELARVLRRLEGQGMKRLVLDLRRNTGGLLPQAIEVADKFLSGNRVIVKTKGRIASANAEHNSTDSPTDVTCPMIVLISERSASASEIVSGALQDWDRALIIGKTSFGKGLVQSQIEFDDHSALLLTVGRWYTPLGRLIQKDYTNKSRRQYRIDAYSDSLNTVLNRDENRPAFTTPMGRTVYGGGGITPDIALNPTTFSTPYVAELINSNSSDDPYFRYTQQYAFNHPDKWKNVEELVDGYKLEGNEFYSYFQFLNNENFKLSDREINEKSRKLLEWYLKWRLAEFLWGDEGRIKAYVVDDNVLWESLEYFDAAANLVKN